MNKRTKDFSDSFFFPLIDLIQSRCQVKAARDIEIFFIDCGIFRWLKFASDTVVTVCKETLTTLALLK